MPQLQYGKTHDEEEEKKGEEEYNTVATTLLPRSSGHSCACIALVMGALVFVVSLAILHKIDAIAGSIASAQAGSTESQGKFLQDAGNMLEELRTMNESQGKFVQDASNMLEELRTVKAAAASINSKLDATGAAGKATSAAAGKAHLYKVSTPSGGNCELPAGATWCTVRSDGFTFDMAVYATADIVSSSICGSGTWGRSPLDIVAYVGKVGSALDIGGNVGYYTMMLAKAGWQVHTFEPLPFNLALINATLCKNTDIQQQVSVHPVGLGKAAVSCSIVSGDINVGDGIVNCDGAGEWWGDGYRLRHTFESVRLDDELEYSGVTEIDFVKLDVEGFECQVLEGGQSLMTKYRPKLITSEVWGSMNGCQPSDYLRQFNDAHYVVAGEGDMSCGTDACCSVPEAGIYDFRFCRKE